ncbi:homeobox protein H2.0 [Sitodiplosis mosellana]|uniref:homeobox protein H2.0 n=1 Tax=Sitodiplosis mosellana TaxID=263140 RepID=UPI002444B1F4|nr:homeobox protein H2.0 [Sitodiplosis mosellana]
MIPVDGTNKKDKFVYRRLKDMEMNVHSKKFALCSKADEQLVTDDRNNNLKNDQLTEKQQTMIQENNEITTQWKQIDELRLKFQNSEQNMDKHSSDTHSNDSHSSGPMETIKSSAAINFSVESILNGSSCTKKCDIENVDQKSLERGHSPQKSAIPEDCSRIYRPMPMRYVSNPTAVYHGFPMNSAPLPLHRHIKYPIPNFHGAPLPPTSFSPSFSVDRFLLPTAVSFSHFQSSHHRADCLVDPTNPKITAIPAPCASSINNTAALSQSKRKRSWSRAVFSQLQRKGLEIQFQIQKYITKPDRRKLAARLGLTDAQVKVWFQNRRMKWRHSRQETKVDKNRAGKTENKEDGIDQDIPCGSSAESDSCSSDDGNEIDIEAE